MWILGDDLDNCRDDDDDDDAIAVSLGDHPVCEEPLPVDFLLPNLVADDKTPLLGERGEFPFLGLPISGK
jgi:hypothetical protein